MGGRITSVLSRQSITMPGSIGGAVAALMYFMSAMNEKNMERIHAMHVEALIAIKDNTASNVHIADKVEMIYRRVNGDGGANK